MKKRARGQTLVIFALTMLFMVVMVCITLAIGMKAREKMELQTMADAAALSNATAAARTYNAVAVLTRAQISHMVVVAGIQSHISYAGWYYGALKNLELKLQEALAGPCASPSGCLVDSCIQAAATLAAVQAELVRIDGTFTAGDTNAATEAFLRQGHAGTIREAQRELYGQHFIDFVARGGFTQNIIDLAVPQAGRRAEYVISAGGIGVSSREIGGPDYDEALAGATSEGAYLSNSSPDLALKAAHGGRRSSFTRVRGLSPANLGSFGALIGSPAGSGYFAEGLEDVRTDSSPYAAWGNDDGVIAGAIGCLPIATDAISAYVKSTDDADTPGTDHHTFGGAPAPAGHTHPLSTPEHTMGSCGAECPSVWVNRVEFNLRGPEDQWGQPKQYVVLDRDYSRRTGPQDPWNLFFRFRFTNTGNGQTVDLGKTQGGAEFTHQAAIATAITYYHRHGDDGARWAEPPNFFNPFWRATLVPADIDEQGVTDMNVAASPLGPAGAQALDALRNAGFRGWQ